MTRTTLSRALVFGGLVTMTACATIDVPNDGWRRGGTPSSAGSEDDPCAPENTPRYEDDPTATCARKTDRAVPDLTVGTTSARSNEGGKVGTQSLKPLAGPNETAPSCNGKAGPGFNTCGPNGTDSCCRTATVPPGKAGAKIDISVGFDLGVYEVTAGRLRAFIDAVGGDVRSAATSGKLPGFDATLAQRLPASRAAVDDELGPACKFRGDPRNYGARTWWSQDVQDAVASLMTDNNARAADIRTDASKARLDAKPANCVSYALAAAFCAWDGGRLPSNGEWEYAAVGGEQLREYPWGAGRTVERAVTDLTRSQQIPGGMVEPAFTWPADFPFFANGMNAYHIAPPGRKPAGAARWGHQDMGGNVLEWMADREGDAGIVRGGSWEGHDEANATTFVGYPLDRTYGSVGLRCAYGEKQPATNANGIPANVTLVSIYWADNPGAPDWLLTTTQNEGAPAYTTRGVAFRALAGAPKSAATEAPLHRCRRPNGRHFVSNDPGCEGNGNVDEGVLGTVHRTEAPGTKPIYRCYHPQGDFHLTRMESAECVASGMVVEGTQGFAYPRP